MKYGRVGLLQLWKHLVRAFRVELRTLVLVSLFISTNSKEKGMSQPPAERKYKYQDHRDISPDMVDYLLSVADVSNIYSLDIEEINDYLNDLEQYQDEQYVQHQQSNRSM